MYNIEITKATNIEDLHLFSKKIKDFLDKESIDVIRIDIIPLTTMNENKT